LTSEEKKKKKICARQGKWETSPSTGFAVTMTSGVDFSHLRFVVQGVREAGKRDSWGKQRHGKERPANHPKSEDVDN